MTSTNDYQFPDEDVYPATTMPTKEQANAEGHVLWFAEGYGWYVAWFNAAHMPNTTHWTLIPDRPVCSNGNALRDAEFDKWIRYTFNNEETRKALRETLCPAFYAGWSLGRQPNVNH